MGIGGDIMAATFDVNFYSESLKRCVSFIAFIPNDGNEMWTKDNPNYQRPMKTLFLLHGYCGNRTDWGMNSLAADLSGTYNMAVIMPSGDNSFYLNAAPTGQKYEDYLAKDLVEYVRKTFGIAKTPEDTFICGLSMGGFGALHTGLAHPEVFGKMAGLSSALISDGLKSMKPGDDNGMANYEYYAHWFGPLDKIDESHANPKFVVKERLSNGEKIQPIFIAIGTEDFLLMPNRDFRDFLIANNVEVEYHESKGIHNWVFWNEYLEPAIKWFLQ